MEKNIYWNCEQKHPVKTFKTNEKSQVTSTLWKKLVEKKDIDSQLLKAENYHLPQECSSVCQDFPLNRNAVLRSENIFHKTSPIKIMRNTSKYPYYESFQEPLTSTPVAPDLTSSSFGKSSAYKVVKYLNLSADSNDKYNVKSDRIAATSITGQKNNIPLYPEDINSSFSLGPSDLHSTAFSGYMSANDERPHSHDRYMQNFWDTRITSPGVPSPITRTSNNVEEGIGHHPAATAMNSSNLSSRPFPVTPPPDHHYQKLKFRTHSGATVPQTHYTDHSSYLDISSNQALNTESRFDDGQHLLTPEYFSRQPVAGTTSYSNEYTLENSLTPHKTDIVTLMKELALTYGGSFSDEQSAASYVQNELLHKKSVDYCVFCKRNNEHATFYRSHTLRDRRGLCQCPILRVYVCPLCKGTGDNAHTLKYCPFNTVTGGDPISAGLPPGKVTNWRNMAAELFTRK